MKPLLRELQRRRVPQVLGLYTAGCFAVSQGVQLLEDALQLPGWVLTVTVIASLAALPLVAVAGWLFDIGGEGVVRTPDQPATSFRWSALHVGIASAAVAALMLGGWIALRPRPDEVDRVAVLPLQNRTGDPALESLGEVAADWITESLVQASFVNVVDLQTTLRAGMGASSRDRAVSADRLITGTYYRAGDRLIFRVRITSSKGELIEALQPIQGAAGEPTQGLSDLRDRVVATLARAIDRRIANFEGAGSAPSYPAYESYVEGLHAYLAGDFRGAVPLFQRAFELDSTFLRAQLWAGAAAAFSNDYAGALRIFDALMARSRELSPYDRHHLSFFHAVVTTDAERAYAEALALVKASPGSDDAARELGLSALRTGRIQEAITRFEQLERVSGISRDWPEYFFVLSMAYEAKGELERAMDVARKGRGNDTTSESLAALAWVAAAQGNTSLAMAAADTLAQQFPQTQHLYRIGVRLNAAGQRTEAIRLWRQSALLATSPTHRALSLYYAGDYEPAQMILDSIGNTIDPTKRVLGLRGLIAARRRNLPYARAVLDSLKAEAPVGSARWQARIHAVLGERDAAAKLVGHTIFDGNLEILNRYDPDLLALAGHPGFERAMRPRR